ncbi:UNVERIFIED_ORG: hypothetical protein M2312_000459 [Rhizobium esperanzae]|nr:hypothetical protein [Rhizobium esperanzae]
MLGTPTEIAERMQQWFENGAADGFNVMPPFFPGGLDDFTRDVVPILQERGLSGPNMRARRCATIWAFPAQHWVALHSQQVADHFPMGRRFKSFPTPEISRAVSKSTRGDGYRRSVSN